LINHCFSARAIFVLLLTYADRRLLSFSPSLRAFSLKWFFVPHRCPLSVLPSMSTNQSSDFVADLRWYAPPVVCSLVVFFLAETVFHAPLLLAVGSRVNIDQSNLRSVADLR
jgi:hypothetical protein